jgi:hypothetical protein
MTTNDLATTAILDAACVSFRAADGNVHYDFIVKSVARFSAGRDGAPERDPRAAPLGRAAAAGRRDAGRGHVAAHVPRPHAPGVCPREHHRHLQPPGGAQTTCKSDLVIATRGVSVGVGSFGDEDSVGVGLFGEEASVGAGVFGGEISDGAEVS